MAVTKFQEKVYSFCIQIPWGMVTTYKEISRALNGSGKVSRAVGNALHKNPFAPRVPCHRVICSDGRIGGFATGTKCKMRMLKKEGITFKAGKVAEMDRIFYKFL